MKTRTMFSRGLWNIWFWVVAGLTFWALNSAISTDPRSRYWPAELGLYTLMLGGMWADARGHPISQFVRLPRVVAPFVYVFLVWLFGMVYELTLTVNGEGVGGLHPSTVPSFLLAQGDYIPIAIVAYFVIRQTHASFKEVFFLAGGKSLTEGIVFTGVLVSQIASPFFFLSPLTLAYYTLAYASFIAAPLVLVDAELLWDTSLQPKRYSVPFFWALGFVLAFAIRIFWGLVYGPLVTRLFNLPPPL
ncbi:MAG: hypothetical protein HY835_09930 [Anaerolineae bacterium]|nr:hypothetical protein [Anaerolineae bacterium]